MTKKDIIQKISEQMDLPQFKVKEIVQMTFDAIIESLTNDGRIELRRFGVFEVKYRKPRQARNPKTGSKVKTSGRNVIHFKPGKEMNLNIQTFNVGKTDKTGTAESTDKIDNADKTSKTDKVDKTSKTNKTDKTDKAGKAGKKTK